MTIREHIVPLTAGAVLLVLAAWVGDATAASGARASRACRNSVARVNEKLARLSLAQTDGCHGRQARRGGGRDCNVLRGLGDGTQSAVGLWKHRAGAIIDFKCAADDPVLENYPGVAGQGDAKTVLDTTTALIETNGASVLAPGVAQAGGSDVGGCRAAIAAARSEIVLGIVDDATDCQRRRDRRASTFGPLHDDCAPAAGRRETRAADRIAARCAGVGGTAAGSCEPLPACAVAAARETGLLIAQGTFGAQCGNGELDEGEECDDGNRDDTDGCTSKCREPVCGNGVIEGTEECDDGNGIDRDGCTACVAGVCGDGVLEVGVEECDDGNATSGDGCSACLVDAVECTGDRIWVDVAFIYDAEGFTPIAGMQFQLGYDPALVTIPGSGSTAEVRGRIVRRPNGFFGASDLAVPEGGPENVLQTTVAVSSGAVSSGSLEVVAFDCTPGTRVKPSNFGCRALDVTDPFLNAVGQDQVDANTRCEFTVSATDPTVP